MDNCKIFIGNELRSMQNLTNKVEDNFTFINSESVKLIVSSKGLSEKRVECLNVKSVDKKTEKQTEKLSVEKKV